MKGKKGKGPFTVVHVSDGFVVAYVDETGRRWLFDQRQYDLINHVRAQAIRVYAGYEPARVRCNALNRRARHPRWTPPRVLPFPESLH